MDHHHHYVGRFAPSPSGPLHLGSLVAAMASYLDAKAHHGQWLVRIEDIDETRTLPLAAQGQLQVLKDLQMHWDGEVVWQSQRKPLYLAAAERIAAHTYPCGCSRREIADSQAGLAIDGAAVYPGTCRTGLAAGKTPRSLRLRVPEAGDAAGLIGFHDRWCGPQQQILGLDVGDFVLRQVDGFWAYQLVLVVDDAEQGVTDVVRGMDLLDSSARQIYLHRLLGSPVPRYLHIPVVKNAQGEKLSKQNGALAVEIGDTEATRVKALREAGRQLGLMTGPAESLARFWAEAIPAWGNLLQSRKHLP